MTFNINETIDSNHCITACNAATPFVIKTGRAVSYCNDCWSMKWSGPGVREVQIPRDEKPCAQQLSVWSFVKHAVAHSRLTHSAPPSSVTVFNSFAFNSLSAPGEESTRASDIKVLTNGSVDIYEIKQ